MELGTRKREKWKVKRACDGKREGESTTTIGELIESGVRKELKGRE